MKLDDNPQMVAMLDHAKGSLENKIRQAYNSGYNDGFKAGVFEAWDDMRKQFDKSLRQQIEQTEPQTEDCGACEHSRITCRYMECGEPCHYEPKTDWHYDEQDATWYPYKHEDELQTEKPKIRKRIDKPFRAVWLDDDHNEIGTPQTEREGE